MSRGFKQGAAPSQSGLLPPRTEDDVADSAGARVFRSSSAARPFSAPVAPERTSLVIGRVEATGEGDFGQDQALVQEFEQSLASLDRDLEVPRVSLRDGADWPLPVESFPLLEGQSDSLGQGCSLSNFQGLSASLGSDSLSRCRRRDARRVQVLVVQPRLGEDALDGSLSQSSCVAQRVDRSYGLGLAKNREPGAASDEDESGRSNARFGCFLFAQKCGAELV